MLSNVGHTIQKLINNTPVSVSADNSTSAIVTAGGSVYQAGLIADKIQASFENIRDNVSVLGSIVKTDTSDDGTLYLLNSAGSVFAYEFNDFSCSPVVRDIYIPESCRGIRDRAVDIQAGADHIVILTEGGKVYGSGDNTEYQIIPQGQCNYRTAVQMFVTDTLMHNNKDCDSLTGHLNFATSPVYPDCNGSVCKPSCISGTLTDVTIGQLNVWRSSGDTTNGYGVPLNATLNYVGFVCCGSGQNSGNFTGSLTVTITSLTVDAGTYYAPNIIPFGQGILHNGSVAGAVVVPTTIDVTDLFTSSQTLAISGSCGSSLSITLDIDLRGDGDDLRVVSGTHR